MWEFLGAKLGVIDPASAQPTDVTRQYTSEGWAAVCSVMWKCFCRSVPWDRVLSGVRNCKLHRGCCNSAVKLIVCDNSLVWRTAFVIVSRSYSVLSVASWLQLEVTRGWAPDGVYIAACLHSRRRAAEEIRRRASRRPASRSFRN